MAPFKLKFRMGGSRSTSQETETDPPQPLLLNNVTLAINGSNTTIDSEHNTDSYSSLNNDQRALIQNNGTGEQIGIFSRFRFSLFTFISQYKSYSFVLFMFMFMFIPMFSFSFFFFFYSCCFGVSTLFSVCFYLFFTSFHVLFLNLFFLSLVILCYYIFFQSSLSSSSQIRNPKNKLLAR